MSRGRHTRTSTVREAVAPAPGGGRLSGVRRPVVAAAVPLLVLGGGSAVAAGEGAARERAAAPAPPTSSPAVPLVPVPAAPFEAPAAPAPVRSGGTAAAPLAPAVAGSSPQQVIASLETGGIPRAALTAYERTQQLLGAAAPSCHLPWQLVAAIGRVESDHGRFGRSVLRADGRAVPGILGPRLDGSGGFARVADTDGGRWDGDRVVDRAVGPMQFLPGTWRLAGVDADRDGTVDPQDIDDAAAAAGRYLCAGGVDLADADQLRAAVYRYNHSWEYVDLVLGVARAYGAGQWAVVPDGQPAATSAGASSSQSRAATPAPATSRAGTPRASANAPASAASETPAPARTDVPTPSTTASATPTRQGLVSVPTLPLPTSTLVATAPELPDPLATATSAVGGVVGSVVASVLPGGGGPLG